MKILILRSRAADQTVPPGEFEMQLDTLYADRVIGNLRNGPCFCTACADGCSDCRADYTFQPDIAGIIDFPSRLPYLLERPADHLPADIPEHDMILAIAVHEQILIEIAEACADWRTKAIVVPLESANWMSSAARARIRTTCEQSGIECEFPKPFCTFDPPSGSLLDRFRREYRIGKPVIDLELDGNRIRSARVRVSAACGATYYVARGLPDRDLDDDLETEVISRRFHSYPCTASMEWDDEIGDTPLHLAAHAHVEMAARLPPVLRSGDVETRPLIRSPMGRMIHPPAPDNQQKIESAKEIVLQELRANGHVDLSELRQRPDIIPAALSSALLLLKKDGLIRMKGTTIERAG